MTSKFVAEGLVAYDADGPRLLGGRRKSDGKIVFPMPRGADAVLFEQVPLSRDGRLWSYTVQRFQPKPPYRGPLGAVFAPYPVGYVELPGEVIVESRLIADPAELRLGLPMRLAVEPVFADADGAEVFTFAFRPTEPAR
jgi:uncharacterized OB-fold protein